MDPLIAATEANLMAARYQMAISLGFHIILACFGIGFPLIAFIAHRLGWRRSDVDALRLAKRWAKTMAVLFAVGAVSGTILSFELGALWPGLMGPYGDVVGLMFALEGIAFFVEAIFIAIYLYGWSRLPARLHSWMLAPIALAGMAGSFFVVAANAWMNSPSGFDVAADGSIINVDPWAAMFNDAALVQWSHMLFAAYMVSGFMVASVYAIRRLRGDRSRITRLGFLIAFSVAAVATPVQVLIGDVATRRLVEAQPSKFAAMELLPESGSRAPLTIGGIYVDGEVVGAIEIPGLASWLATRSVDGEVPGFDVVNEEDLPPVNVVHWAFQIMVGIGTALLLLSVWFAFVWWRRRGPPESRWFWRSASVAGIAAIVAMEAGWTTTEVGRQPWIVWQQVRTTDAVSSSSGIVVSAIAISLIYVVLGILTVTVIRIIGRRMREGEDVPAPYGPLPDRETAS
ncbi:MAG: cytochrome ubiquinol oxidase subunit I [Acidimicrobiia bacterium]